MPVYASHAYNQTRETVLQVGNDGKGVRLQVGRCPESIGRAPKSLVAGSLGELVEKIEALVNESKRV